MLLRAEIHQWLNVHVERNQQISQCVLRKDQSHASIMLNIMLVDDSMSPAEEGRGARIREMDEMSLHNAVI